MSEKLDNLQQRIDSAARKHGAVEAEDMMKRLMNSFEAENNCGMYWRGAPTRKPHVFEAMTQDKAVLSILKKYSPAAEITDQFAAQLMVDGLCILQVALRAEFSKQEATRIETELLGLSDVLAELEDNIG